MQFDIEIKNEKIKAYRVITLLVVLLNILYFVASSFELSQRKSALTSLGFILLYIVYRFLKLRKAKHTFFFDEWIYFLLMILWVDNYAAAILCMILFLSYTISLQKIIYNFDAAFVKQRNFPWKKHQWSQLNNVILKDNLLTIDFKNNKLMQAEITNTEINEGEFNAFVKKSLVINRVKND